MFATARSRSSVTPLPSPQQLRYLLALGQHLHFGRAASACSVTQSTLSAGILALERQLDASLIDRDATKHVLFTATGREVLARAREALVALEAVAEAAIAARAPMSGPVRLGIIPTVGPFLLPRLMPTVRRSYPMMRLFLREDTTLRLIERLDANRLDVAILALPCACGTAETLAVGRDAFLAALPAGHALASFDVVPVAALATERLLLLEDGHCLRDQALDACGYVSREAPEAGDDFAATSLHTLVQMVASGLGVTLLPQLAIEAGITRETGIVLRPLAGAGGWRTLGLAWRRNAPRAAEWRALAGVVAQVLARSGGALAEPQDDHPEGGAHQGDHADQPA